MESNNHRSKKNFCLYTDLTSARKNNDMAQNIIKINELNSIFQMMGRNWRVNLKIPKNYVLESKKKHCL